MVQVMQTRDPSKAMKVARQEHRCCKCGTIIKPGARFAMCLDYSTFRSYPMCLRCYTDYRPEEYR